MASCLVILDEEFGVLLQRALRPLKCLSEAIRHLQNELKLYKRTLVPVFEKDGWYFTVINRDGVYFASIALLQDKLSPITLLEYLEQLHRLIKRSIGEKLNRINIADNFHLIFELIDETMDYGVIQITDYNILRDFMKVEVIKAEEKDGKDQQEKKKELDENSTYQDESFLNSHMVRTITSAISWRLKGINYSKNEFFLDVIESLEFTMDMRNKVVRNNVVTGVILCRCFLSGMPQLSIGLNKLSQRNVQFIKQLKFHQCVDLKRILEEDSNVVRFIPPDGEFELCRYRLKRSLKDEPVIKLQYFHTTFKSRKNPSRQDRVLLRLGITSHFRSQDKARSLRLKIPAGPLIKKWKVDLSKNPVFKSDIGDVVFNVTEGLILWEVHHLKGGHGEKIYELRCMFEIWDQELHEIEERRLRESMDPPPLRTGIPLEKVWEQFHPNSEEIRTEDQKVDPTVLVNMSFEIPYFAVSGLKVDYLKIEEPQLNYQSFPWIRYRTVGDKEYAYQVSF